MDSRLLQLLQQPEQQGLSNAVELIRRVGLGNSGPKTCFDVLRQSNGADSLAASRPWSQQVLQANTSSRNLLMTEAEMLMVLKAENERLVGENERLHRTNKHLETNNKKLLVSSQQHTDKTKKLLKRVDKLKGIVAGLESQAAKNKQELPRDADKKLKNKTESLELRLIQGKSAAVNNEQHKDEAGSLKRHNEQTRSPSQHSPRVRFDNSVLVDENDKFRHEIKRLKEENASLRTELDTNVEQKRSEIEILRLSQALHEMQQGGRAAKRMKIHRWE